MITKPTNTHATRIKMVTSQQRTQWSLHRKRRYSIATSAHQVSVWMTYFFVRDRTPRHLHLSKHTIYDKAFYVSAYCRKRNIRHIRSHLACRKHVVLVKNPQNAFFIWCASSLHTYTLTPTHNKCKLVALVHSRACIRIRRQQQ